MTTPLLTDPGRARPRGLAFDLDGTLLNSDHTISQAVGGAVRGLVAQGVPIVLVSARPPRSVLAIARELGLAGGMVSLNGAMVADISGTIIDANLIAPHIVAGVQKLGRAYAGLTTHYYRWFDWLTTEYNDDIQRETAIIGFSPTVTPSHQAIHEISKLMIVGPAAELEGLEADILAAGWPITAQRSKPTYLEITSPGVTKAAGLGLVATRHGLEPEDFMAFGDGDNDVSMFEVCGYGVAMGNASDRLKAVADMVIGTNDEDAIADFLAETMDIERAGPVLARAGSAAG